jgi:hypothetical protein
MSEPLFPLRSARLALPLLFAGQSQKELFVNESLARIDSLLHCAIEGKSDAPPVDPVDGECWLIGAAPTGPWSGRGGQIALFESGQWLFQSPLEGMTVFNRTTGQDMRFRQDWVAPTRPTLPSGGSIIDAEVRTALAELIDSLVTAGILPSN